VNIIYYSEVSYKCTSTPTLRLTYSPLRLDNFLPSLLENSTVQFFPLPPPPRSSKIFDCPILSNLSFFSRNLFILSFNSLSYFSTSALSDPDPRVDALNAKAGGEIALQRRRI